MTLVAPTPALARQNALGPATVLIVDDERANRDVLEITLKSEGLAVRSAVSGESALELIAAAPPDLIVLYHDARNGRIPGSGAVEGGRRDPAYSDHHADRPQ